MNVIDEYLTSVHTHTHTHTQVQVHTQPHSRSLRTHTFNHSIKSHENGWETQLRTGARIFQLRCANSQLLLLCTRMLKVRSWLSLANCYQFNHLTALKAHISCSLNNVMTQHYHCNVSN
ncbi:hypothetical protein ANANG_G00296690 [Anguilla anguilla]|uniref:Uncharacterized protein n=1 Tax=Anguilla anguilla TaxID=7936 RepID=A0A9D3LL14_ANGAN|nr:hypothetical protein ANANG_G00296690 [Anguilla anguilla]